MGLVEIAGTIISRAQQRVDVSAQNMANLTTGGYKARRQFSQMIVEAGVDSLSAPDDSVTATDFTDGKLRNTGNNLDLAISGRGFFTVRSGSETLYTRDGQFSRDSDGHLVTSGGAILQSDRGDLVIGSGNFTVMADGTVLQDGQPTDHVAIADFAQTSTLRSTDAGMFAAPAGAANSLAAPQIHQGMLETSNVSTADEMLSVMAALRGAEAGQRMVQVYDDLMGRAVSAFGQT